MIKVGKSTLAAVVALVLFATGCEGPFKKKKPAPPPSIPPTIEKPKVDLPQPQPTPPPPPKPEATIQPTPQPKPQPKRKPTKKVVPPPAPEETTPQPKPATPDASINAPMTNQQADRQRQQTSSLIGSAEGNLSNIHRALNVDEQNMVAQIRSYIAQSRKAMTDGDLERAYNLANKANLLSSELMKE